MADGKLILEKAKKTLKFIWRHFFTLWTLKILVFVFLNGPVNWTNMCFIIMGAVVIDWVKQFIKPYITPYWVRPYCDITAPFHIRQRWDSSLIGNCTHESDNRPRIKYD